MRKVGFVVYPGYQTMGFALISAFELANRQAAEHVYDIRMLSKDGGLSAFTHLFRLLANPSENGNVLSLCPDRRGSIYPKARLGGILNFYQRVAAQSEFANNTPS
jgi:hypothetical protein